MGYKALLVLEKILMSLPKRARKAFFSFLAFVAYHTLKKYRKIVHANLDFAFDNKMSNEEKDFITRYSFKNLMYNFMHLMELRHMDKEEFKKRVTVKNLDIVKKVEEEGRAIVYVTPHYCSWEFAGASLGVYAKPAGIVYKGLKNKQYEEWLLDARGRFGNVSLEKSNVLRVLIKRVKEKLPIGILTDTNINKREGIEVIFMGKTIHQAPTPAILSRKFNAAIIPAAIKTTDEEHYEVTFYDEIKTPKTDDEEADILASTQAQADWLSELITKEPKFWFWLHRRWKNDHPYIYENI